VQRRVSSPRLGGSAAIHRAMSPRTPFLLTWTLVNRHDCRLSCPRHCSAPEEDSVLDGRHGRVLPEQFVSLLTSCLASYGATSRTPRNTCKTNIRQHQFDPPYELDTKSAGQSQRPLSFVLAVATPHNSPLLIPKCAVTPCSKPNPRSTAKLMVKRLQETDTQPTPPLSISFLVDLGGRAIPSLSARGCQLAA
jgi:hypothetical protein